MENKFLYKVNEIISSKYMVISILYIFIYSFVIFLGSNEKTFFDMLNELFSNLVYWYMGYFPISIFFFKKADEFFWKNNYIIMNVKSRNELYKINKKYSNNVYFNFFILLVFVNVISLNLINKIGMGINIENSLKFLYKIILLFFLGKIVVLLFRLIEGIFENTIISIVGIITIVFCSYLISLCELNSKIKSIFLFANIEHTTIYSVIYYCGIYTILAKLYKKIFLKFDY